MSAKAALSGEAGGGGGDPCRTRHWAGPSSSAAAPLCSGHLRGGGGGILGGAFGAIWGGILGHLEVLGGILGVETCLLRKEDFHSRGAACAKG